MSHVALMFYTYSRIPNTRGEEAIRAQACSTYGHTVGLSKSLADYLQITLSAKYLIPSSAVPPIIIEAAVGKASDLGETVQDEFEHHIEDENVTEHHRSDEQGNSFYWR